MTELSDLPVGTGSLFVTSHENPSKLVKENRCMNLTERQECLVVQYLAAGGEAGGGGGSLFPPDGRKPERIFSGVHSGAGPLVFGSGVRQRADLALFFPSAPGEGRPCELVFHNYHGYHWHYTGHPADCPAESIFEPFRWDPKSLTLDTFRRAYAAALSEVRPENVLFKYSVSTSCDYWHGKPIRSLASLVHGGGSAAVAAASAADNVVYYENLTQLMTAEQEAFNFYVHPAAEFAWSKDFLLQKILEDSVHGFVTLLGGEETKTEDEAASRFGFCVQNYAPLAEEISPYTKAQIREFMGGTDDEAAIDTYINRQPDRTLNSGTFHSEETISTSYLKWLIRERGFANFEITHFIRYKFDDHAREFVEPILQKRHEVKQKGDVPHAEALKLIANSDYGYQGLEASKYDDCRLITGTNLRRARTTAKMLHLSLKHVTLLGIVRLKQKKKKQKKNEDTGAKRKRPKRSIFVEDEAQEADDDDDDEDDSCGEEEEDEEEEDEQRPRGLSESETGSSSDTCSVAETADLNELAIRSFEEASSSSSSWCATTTTAATDEDSREMTISHDHSYSSFSIVERNYYGRKRKKTVLAKRGGDHSYCRKKKSKYVYDFLYSVVSSGEHKAIKNCLPKAVAILSNSKVIFLSHINTMLRCLDPRLAEICYTDTDSCIFSMTHRELEDNLRADKVEEWKKASILADETGPLSCHGKMKLEGFFTAGLFKALKIYRLFSDTNFDREFTQKTCYTRCKGVNRNIAKIVPNSVFHRDFLGQVVVHRSCLRPGRTGEMLIAHEAKSLAKPFNIKRFVTNDGLHTFPLSYLADGRGGDPL